MISKNRIKYLKSLSVKKYRQQEQKFLVEGKKIVFDGLKSNFICEEIFLNGNEEFSEILEFAKLKSVQITEIDNKSSDFLADTKNCQGIFGVFRFDNSEFKQKSDFVLILDNISDPGNLGTILRTADWFGVEEVIISSNSVDVYNPKVVRAAMGSLFHLKMRIDENLPKTVENLQKKGFLVLLADIEGADYRDSDFKSGKRALILSNEANGVSAEIKEIVKKTITIPQKGKAESLNVAIAGSILIAELLSK